MIIRRQIVKSTFLFIFSDPESVFSLCFVCSGPEIMSLQLCPFFIKDYGNMSFHGNQIGDMVQILQTKTFY